MIRLLVLGRRHVADRLERPMVTDLRESAPVGVEPLEQRKPVASLPDHREERRPKPPIDYPELGIR